MDSNKIQELEQLAYNCLGVLITLKQSGEINLTENKFIKALSSSIYEDHSQQFHEIHDAILNITSKNK